MPTNTTSRFLLASAVLSITGFLLIFCCTYCYNWIDSCKFLAQVLLFCVDCVLKFYFSCYLLFYFVLLMLLNCYDWYLVSVDGAVLASSFILSNLSRSVFVHKISYLTWRENGLANFDRIWQVPGRTIPGLSSALGGNSASRSLHFLQQAKNLQNGTRGQTLRLLELSSE